MPTASLFVDLKTGLFYTHKGELVSSDGGVAIARYVASNPVWSQTKLIGSLADPARNDPAVMEATTSFNETAKSVSDYLKANGLTMKPSSVEGNKTKTGKVLKKTVQTVLKDGNPIPEPQELADLRAKLKLQRKALEQAKKDARTAFRNSMRRPSSFAVKSANDTAVTTVTENKEDGQ